MSSATAPIAATTEALWRLLDRELRIALPGVRVNACPPNRIRTEAGGLQVNLYLFRVVEDPTRRNVQSAGMAALPLALTLHYLVSVYGDESDGVELSAHQLLGEAMRLLHKHSVISPGGDYASPGGDYVVPPPALHVSLQALSLDDMNKLWATWQTPYRLSVVYEVSPVFLDLVG